MKNNLWGLCTLALFSATVTAQQDSVAVNQLDEVVVTDSRFAIKRENSGRTVIKIDSLEIQRNQGKTLAELLNTQAGFELSGSRSNAGQDINLFSRGGNNRQVLMLIDGIQVLDPSSLTANFDLRLLNLSQIQSIEIIKGAASTLYGNAAATAVINITTKKASEPGWSVNLTSSAGTNQSADDQNFEINDFSNAVNLGYREGKFRVDGSFSNQNTNGLSAAVGTESDPFNRNNASLGLGYAFSSAFSASLKFYYDEMNFAFDNGFPVEDADNRSKSEQLRYQLGSVYDYGSGSLHFNAAFNKIDRQFISAFPSQFDSESFTFDLFHKYIIASKWHTIVGLNLIDQQTEFENEEATTTVDPYANVVYVSDFGLNLNVGARLNNHSEYGSNLVYNFNPSYRFKVQEGYLKFFGSYATSFIAPNLSQLFGAFGPNPDLDPEENATFEIGFEYRPSTKLRLSALYFDRKEENFIAFEVVDPDTFEFQYRNVENVINVNGFEVELAAQLAPELQWVANYTFTESSDLELLRVPKNKVNSRLDFTLSKKWMASLNFQHNAGRQDIDFGISENVNFDAFNLFGLYTSYQFNAQVRAFLNVENLFNEEYFEIAGFTTRGRNLRLGVQINL
ncbi:TonB-dependent receptor [Flagellimonas sp. DF-77]|uniref:TonB-dependent receptor plug domain-containing protein n=1 Tax=Flagellimonas algarum TaxID=3230298 RepID=UPI003396E7A8